MSVANNRIKHIYDCKMRMWILALTYFLGILFGVACAGSGFTISSLMRTAASSGVSIVHLLCRTVGPFLLSILALRYQKYWLLYVISFTKAFLFALCAFSLAIVFGRAAWLIHILLFFSESIITPVLFLFWFQHINRRTISIMHCVPYIAFCLIVAAVEYCYIAPLLSRVINC